MNTIAYHPDAEFNALIAQEALEGEIVDLAAGFPPRHWVCECGASHSRGHFISIGNHRCLKCGYTGPGGVMMDDGEYAEHQAIARATGRKEEA